YWCALLLAFPVSAQPLAGKVNLQGNLGPIPATTGVIYVVPDTPENWQQLNGLAQRAGRFAALTRYTATQVQTMETLYNFNVAQERLKGLLNRLVLVARDRAQQVLSLENGQFDSPQAPEAVILVVSAQATPVIEPPVTLAGWWMLRTVSTTDLEFNQGQQLYQVGIPKSVQTPTGSSLASP
ncbi:hypothetical protein, partial [Candidatus Cyanaurora vandensis]